MLLGSAEPSEAHKVRSKISDAVKRQSEQLVVAFLKAAANNDRNAVDNILEEGAIEVDDSDGALCMHGTAKKVTPQPRRCHQHSPLCCPSPSPQATGRK